MTLFIILFIVLFYFLSDISYNVSENDYYFKKEKYKLLFERLGKDSEIDESVDIKEEVRDGVTVTITTETKKSYSTLSINEKN